MSGAADDRPDLVLPPADLPSLRLLENVIEFAPGELSLVSEWLLRLPEEQFEVVWLAAWEDALIEEGSETVPVETVRSLLLVLARRGCRARDPNYRPPGRRRRAAAPRKAVTTKRTRTDDQVSLWPAAVA